MKNKPIKNKTVVSVVKPAADSVLSDIRALIESARARTASYVNSELTMLYWKVGERIRREILKNKRAEYGQEIIVTLSGQLIVDYGGSFSEKNLRRMIQFAEVFPDESIVVSLIRQLTWTHFIALIPLKDQLHAIFIAKCAGWNVGA